MGGESGRASEQNDDLGAPADLLPEGKLGREFCAALTGVIQGEPESDRMLVRSIRTFATAAREASLTPERTIIVLKHLFHHACSAPPHKDQLEKQELLDRIVAWCIQDYYSGNRAASS